MCKLSVGHDLDAFTKLPSLRKQFVLFVKGTLDNVYEVRKTVEKVVAYTESVSQSSFNFTSGCFIKKKDTLAWLVF